MYMVISRYEVKAGEVDELSRILEKRFLPLVRKVRGFISYSWMRGQGGEMLSVGIFHDEGAAEESRRIAAEFVSKHLSEFSLRLDEIITGEVLLLQGS